MTDSEYTKQSINDSRQKPLQEQSPWPEVDWPAAADGTLEAWPGSAWPAKTNLSEAAEQKVAGKFAPPVAQGSFVPSPILRGQYVRPAPAPASDAHGPFTPPPVSRGQSSLSAVLLDPYAPPHTFLPTAVSPMPFESPVVVSRPFTAPDTSPVLEPPPAALPPWIAPHPASPTRRAKPRRPFPSDLEKEAARNKHAWEHDENSFYRFWSEKIWPKIFFFGLLVLWAVILYYSATA